MILYLHLHLLFTFAFALHLYLYLYLHLHLYLYLYLYFFHFLSIYVLKWDVKKHFVNVIWSSLARQAGLPPSTQERNPFVQPAHDVDERDGRMSWWTDVRMDSVQEMMHCAYRLLITIISI